MPNNSEITRTAKEIKTLEAVKNLLTQQDLKEYLDELEQLHGAFLRTHFADDLKTRSRVTSTYENIRDFLCELLEVDVLDVAV